MDSSYLDRRRPNYLALIIPLLIIVLVVGGVYLYMKGRQGLISPVPPTPSFEVIFMTPTPEQLSPTASPSATPKVTAKPTSAKSPTPSKASATGSPSPTSATSPSPEPSNTPAP